MLCSLLVSFTPSSFPTTISCYIPLHDNYFKTFCQWVNCEESQKFSCFHVIMSRDSWNIFRESLSGSEMMLSNPLLNSRHIVKGSPQWCSRRGYIPRASYSNTSQNTTSAVGQHDYIDSYSYQIDRINGSSSSAFFKKIDILDAFDDAYGGVMVNPERLPSNPNVFARALRLSVHHWKIEGKNGVWLKLPLEKSDLVPVAVKEGFMYHHAERSFVMLTFWIPDGPSLLPSNASHHIGVGGFVINDKDEVLVVQERHCAPTLHGLWKIPTGFILESEEIYSGAVREVKEETGIDTEFVEVVAFRHAHNVSFEKSDLFFVCMLRPLSTAIIVDDHEIQAVKWMPLEEFVNQPLIQEDSMFKKIIDICIARLGKRYCGLSVHQLFSNFDGKLSSLYFNIVKDWDSDCRAE